MADRGPVWLEVALNGPWSRAQQPLIPLSVEEIVAEGVACARAGAAIVHIHARDPGTGAQKDDAELYAAIFEGVRAGCDAIVYPTLPLLGAEGHEAGESVAGRFAAVEALAARGLLEWLVVDPGSATFLRPEAPEGGFLYRNPPDHVRAGLDLARRAGARPSFAIYEPGFARAGAAWAAAAGCPTPVYRFMFSTGFLFGFPPEPFALEAHRALLARVAPGAPWMVAGLDVDVTPLIAPAVAAGGHVRVGLEDAPFGCRLGNLALVEAARAAIEAAGGRLASAAEVRAFR